MRERDVADMIGQVVSEIEGLRTRLAVAEPKAAAYDLLSKVVHGTLPDRGQSYGEDIVWRLKKQREEILTDLVSAGAVPTRTVSEVELDEARMSQMRSTTAERMQDRAAVSEVEAWEAGKAAESGSDA